MKKKDIFIEQQIIAAVRELLISRVNEMLGEMKCLVPLIEFTEYQSGSVVVPVISLSGCEQTEKERIIKQSIYSLTVTFNIPETPESELYCYAYSAAVGRAVHADPTLGGVADRAVVIGKKYVPPKKPLCGEGWELAVSLRVVVEGMTR